MILRIRSGWECYCTFIWSTIFGLHRFLWRILLLSLTIFADIRRFVHNPSPKHSLLLRYECFQKNELKHVYTANWTKYAINACKIYKNSFCTPFSGIPLKVTNMRTLEYFSKNLHEFVYTFLHYEWCKTFCFTLEAMFDETNEFATPK